MRIFLILLVEITISFWISVGNAAKTLMSTWDGDKRLSFINTLFLSLVVSPDFDSASFFSLEVFSVFWFLEKCVLICLIFSASLIMSVLMFSGNAFKKDWSSWDGDRGVFVLLVLILSLGMDDFVFSWSVTSCFSLSFFIFATSPTIFLVSIHQVRLLKKTDRAATGTLNYYFSY